MFHEYLLDISWEAHYQHYFQLLIFANFFSDIKSSSNTRNFNLAPNNARKFAVSTYISKNESKKKSFWNKILMW